LEWVERLERLERFRRFDGVSVESPAEERNLRREHSQQLLLRRAGLQLLANYFNWHQSAEEVGLLRGRRHLS
jgi:hypothetical protein